MTTKEKMLIGLIGIKELIAKQDVAVLAMFTRGMDAKDDGKVEDEIHELHELQKIEKALKDAIGNPLCDVSVTALVKEAK